MKCVIFDLDGTLLYTLDDLYYATNFTLEQFGYKKRTLDEVRNFVGNGIRKLIERSAGEKYCDSEIEKMLIVFRQYYSQNAMKHTRAYEGVLELLKYLKENNVKVGVNSNKYDSAVKNLCEKYFGSLVSSALGESQNCPRKPDPTGVFKILKEFNCEPCNALYVGDSLVDIQTAKNASIPCISVSWGYCSKDLLTLNNKYVADNTNELLEMIKNILSF